MRNAVFVMLVAFAFAVPAQNAKQPTTRPAATKPVAPLDGLKAIAALVPKEHWPDVTNGWTPVQEKMAKEWAKGKLEGHPIKISGSVLGIDAGKRTVSTTLIIPEGEARNGTYGGFAKVVFTESAMASLRDLREGDTITTTGTIKELGIGDSTKRNGPGHILLITLHLTDAALARR
jgi:hypothetical protein